MAEAEAQGRKDPRPSLADRGSGSSGQCRTILLAKAPLPGQVKTRLNPALGAEGAAALAAAMLERAVATALAADLGPVELCVAPALQLPIWERLQLPPGLGWSVQGDGDLGARMARAARRALERGDGVLLIGMDCPDLGVAQLQAAAAGLQHHDATLVPTRDGGYALLGLRRFEASLFTAMAWSTPAVLDETRRRLATAGCSWHEQPPLVDIDTPDDLASLRGELRQLADHWCRAAAAGGPGGAAG